MRHLKKSLSCAFALFEPIERNSGRQNHPSQRMMNHHLSFLGEASATPPTSLDSPKEDHRTGSFRRGNQRIDVQNGISGAWIYFDSLI
jgi:hypothetical protein